MGHLELTFPTCANRTAFRALPLKVCMVISCTAFGEIIRNFRGPVWFGCRFLARDGGLRHGSVVWTATSVPSRFLCECTINAITENRCELIEKKIDIC